MGGKKKKSSNVQIKQESKYKIPKQFNCPLCDGKACLIIKMDKKTNLATVRCRICNQPSDKLDFHFCRLHKPVDIFYMYYEHVWQQDQHALRKKGILTKSAAAKGGGGGDGIGGSMENADDVGSAGKDGPSTGTLLDASVIGASPLSVVVPEHLLHSLQRPSAAAQQHQQAEAAVVSPTGPAADDDEVAGLVENQPLVFDDDAE